MTLAVVISCYRQERFLARTVAALERAFAGHEWEGVVELAVRGDEPLPELPPRWRVVSAWDAARREPGRALTPGAGRMLGFTSCGGEWVLFVDPDVEVESAWVARALDTIAREPRLAAVFGRLEEWFTAGGREWRNARDMYRTGDADRPVDYLAALAFYRRDALAACGGYDPRLNSDEDFELGLRLRQRGFELRSLGMLAGRHWSAPRPSFSELGRRWRTGICFGQGQVLRLYLGRPGLVPLLLRQRLYFAALGLWGLGVLSLLGALAGFGARPFLAWLALPALVIAGMSAKKRSPRLAVHSLLTWTLNGCGMVVGFFTFPSGARPLTGAGEAAC